jgi:hypothetical protein
MKMPFFKESVEENTKILNSLIGSFEEERKTHKLLMDTLGTKRQLHFLNSELIIGNYHKELIKLLKEIEDSTKKRIENLK